MSDTENSNVVELRPPKQEEAEPRYADEIKIFDILAGKARIVVGESIGVDSRDDWPGWMLVTAYDWPWFEDLEGEQNSLDEEKLGIDDEDFDIPIEMFSRVDRFVGALRRFSDGVGNCDYRFDKLKEYSAYDNLKLKRKWEAQGRVVYDIGERTINMFLLVRNGRQRIYAYVTWKAGEDKPIAEEYSVLKADVSDERFHGTWDHWDNREDEHE